MRLLPMRKRLRAAEHESRWLGLVLDGRKPAKAGRMAGWARRSCLREHQPAGSPPCSGAVLFGDPDPAIGNPVQVDQIIGLDLSRLTQSGDDFLDQGWIFPGHDHREGGNARPIRTGHGITVGRC